MIRILFLLAALAFLVVAVMALVQGDEALALRAAAIVLVCSVCAVRGHKKRIAPFFSDALRKVRGWTGHTSKA